jgi:hypothetical protein
MKRQANPGQRGAKLLIQTGAPAPLGWLFDPPLIRNIADGYHRNP